MQPTYYDGGIRYAMILLTTSTKRPVRPYSGTAPGVIKRLAVIFPVFLLFAANGVAQGGPGLPESSLVAIDVTEADDGDFLAAFAAAREAGMQAANLSIFWDEFETAPEVYNPVTNWLAISNSFYPGEGMPVSVTVSVIDTVTTRLPQDLTDRRFDDPELIVRFRNFLDYVFTQIPNVTLTFFGVGNEVDGWLGADAARWSQYETFFIAAANHVRSLRPGTPVGVKIILKGLTGYAESFAQSINQHSDVVLVTHYPLDGGFRPLDPVIVNDSFAQVTMRYPGRTIHFAELGYPSTDVCGGSEQQQATFIREVFAAWRRHRQQVRLVTFTWLTDIPEEAVAQFKTYYGVNDLCFGEYLQTLGIRYPDGTPKPAYHALKEEAVDSMSHCNTLYSLLNLEGVSDGTDGSPWSFCGAERGVVGTLEAR